MLQRRQRAAGLAALSLTAVGAVAGMPGSAYPTMKEPRPAAMGGGWLTGVFGESRVHFALSAHGQETGDFGHLNIKLEGGLGAFWADVTSLQIVPPNDAEIEGVVRKASGIYEACTGEPFDATAHDGEDFGKGDRMQGGCAAGPRFTGQVEEGSLEVHAPESE